MWNIRRLGLALAAAVLAAGPAAGAERIKVFIDQDTSGPGGTDSVSIAMLLLAPNVEVVGIGVVAGDAWLDHGQAGLGQGSDDARVAPAVAAPITNHLVIAAPGVGMTGVYPQAVLRSWDASPFGFITAGDAVRGIVAAARGGPGVINLSFGGEEDDPLVHQAVLWAFRHGSLIVASSGNDGLAGNPLSYPASYPHVLTVGATDETGVVAAFSSQSNDVDLAAPGRHIRVAEPVVDDPSGYIFASGTSFSAPMVSAASAWVWTERPELDNTQLFDVMRFSAHDMDAPGFDRATGFGMLNIPSALTFPTPVRDPLEPNDDIDQVSAQGIFDGGQPAVITASRRSSTITARVDRHEDPHDVYRAFLPAHGSLTARTSGGAVDLRIFPSGARDIGTKAAAVSKKPGLAPESATIRSTGRRGVYVYVEVRPDASTAWTKTDWGVWLGPRARQ